MADMLTAGRTTKGEGEDVSEVKIGHDTQNLPVGTVRSCHVFDIIRRPTYVLAVCVIDGEPQTGICCLFERWQISPNRGDRGTLTVTAAPEGNFWAYTPADPNP